jgi:hypothetical protein
VEIRVASVADCTPNHPLHNLQAVSNDDGDYRAVAQWSMTPGVYCVFAWAAGSDSVSTGQLRFTTNYKRADPPEELDLDVYVK